MTCEKCKHRFQKREVVKDDPNEPDVMDRIVELCLRHSLVDALAEALQQAQEDFCSENCEYMIGVSEIVHGQFCAELRALLAQYDAAREESK